MRPLTFAICLLFALDSIQAQTAAWHPSPGHAQIPIWPGRPPAARPLAEPEFAKTVNGDGQSGVPTLTNPEPVTLLLRRPHIRRNDRRPDTRVGFKPDHNVVDDEVVVILPVLVGR